MSEQPQAEDRDEPAEPTNRRQEHCPDCGSAALQYQGRCWTCRACGCSACA